MARIRLQVGLRPLWTYTMTYFKPGKNCNDDIRNRWIVMILLQISKIVIVWIQITLQPLCRSTRSSARLTTSRRCCISPARHHSALFGLASCQLSTLLYSCSPVLVLHSAWPCFMSAASYRSVKHQWRTGDCMYSYMSCKTSCLLCPGIVVFTCGVTKLDLFICGN